MLHKELTRLLCYTFRLLFQLFPFLRFNCNSCLTFPGIGTIRHCTFPGTFNDNDLLRINHLWPGLLFIALVLPVRVAATTINLPLEGSEKTRQVQSSSLHHLSIYYSFDKLIAQKVTTRQGDFVELHLDRALHSGQIGEPGLPAIKQLIEVPVGARASVSVTRYSTQEIHLADHGILLPVMPLQPSLRKDQKDVPFSYKQQAYQRDEYTRAGLVELEKLGTLRGMQLARLTISPVEYNPVEGTIRVYNNLEIEISFDEVDEQRIMASRARHYSPFFEGLRRQVLSPLNTRSVFDDHPDLTRNPVKMLVVSHRDFEDALQPFLHWKTLQGFHVQILYTDETGQTAQEIQSHIQTIYNSGTEADPPPTFLLLVGDPGKLPASATGSATGEVTDLYYASVDGDYFPEMYYGRLSARNVQELENQLEKILYYQQYQFEDASYLDDVTLIAGSDSYWNPRVGQPTIHYGTQHYFNEGHGFENVNAYLSSYSGCYDEARIATAFINYTAHCSPTSWGNPSLTTSAIHNLTNHGRYPLAVGNCCQSALFSHSESMGEAWMRAAGKGAVAYIGSAPNTYWFEDFYWAVGAFALQGHNDGYVPTFEETTLGAYDAPFVSDFLAVGALKFVGNLAVTEADLQNYQNHSSPLYYWQAYHTLGDPSTFIYYTQGSENAVSHPTHISLNDPSVSIATAHGSYVGITRDGELLKAFSTGEDGMADISLNMLTEPGEITLVVTKSQYIPYITTIEVESGEQPGDVNNDGVINILDLTMLINYVLGHDTPEGFNEEMADVNGDGIVDVNDVVALVNLILHGEMP